MEKKKHISGSKEKKENKIYMTVTEQNELMKFLIEKLAGKSRNDIKALLKYEQVTVNDVVVTQFNHLLKEGDMVSVNTKKAPPVPRIKGMRIIFEDKYLIVIEKAAGLLSIATDKEKYNTAYSYMTEYMQAKEPGGRIFIVHRLDRETSGVMLFAKSDEIRKELQDNWEEIVTERMYTAIVQGYVEKDEDTITSWLKDNKMFVTYSSNIPEDGKKAVTRYKVVKRTKNFSLLNVFLETGRKNQIRVHMQDIGHSIIGDEKYGSTLDPLGRIGLHASVLEFTHPATEKIMRFEADLPKEFNELFE